MANGGSVIFKFEGDTKGIDNATKKTQSALGTLAKSFTIAEIASRALSKGIQIISDNLDSAISRYDTMNNFPKVMKSLGFQTEDAQQAVEELSDGLLGLPTALDESISSVQRLTASNGDIGKSTKIYLAMNDAILAGGASAQVQASAMEQLTQAYSKGKFDAVEYRSIMSAMPGQLKQVATHLGYTSTALGGDLYTALQDGTLSLEDFMGAIVDLDTKGIDGMASFKEQAKSATGGISTSFKNAKTAIVRNITQVIEKINEGTQQYGGISGIIEKITSYITNIIKGLGNIIQWVIDKLPKIIGFLKAISPLIIAVVSGLIAYKTALIAIQVINFASSIASMIAGFISLLPLIKSGTDLMLALNMAFGINPIALLIGAIGALIGVFVLLWNKCEGFRNFWINLWEGIKNAVKTSIAFIQNIFNTVITFFQENWKDILLFIANPILRSIQIII